MPKNSLLLIVLLMFSSVSRAGEARQPAPEGFKKLLRVDPRGGKIMRPPNFDLTKPDAAITNMYGPKLVYKQIYQSYGCYELQAHMPAATPMDQKPNRISGRIRSARSFQVKQNRNYIVSALVRSDFDRNNTEVNLNMGLHAKSGQSVPPFHMLGLPAITRGPDGWQRLEWTITTPIDPQIDEARAYVRIYLRHGDRPFKLQIADFAFVELPPQPLKPMRRGEGVTFPGGPGNLPMKIVSVSQQNGHVIVETTGAKYDLDTTNDTILASQRIEFPRQLAKWHSSLSLTNLRIDQKTDDVCVLSNDQLTIGIQCDSLMVISPQHKLRMELTNLLGGDWNRYERGSLLSEDDFGGFTVDPYIPPGTGLKPQSELLTQNLSFEKLTALHVLQEAYPDGKKAGRYERKPLDVEKPGAAEPGWEAQWTTSPGELFCTSVFPPRPFPWEESFTQGWRIVRHWQKLSEVKKHPKPLVSDWLLWDYIPMMWGHSFSPYFEPYSPENMRKVIDAAHELGKNVIMYMSMYWSPTRDPDVYIDAVRQFKDQYDMDGVYSDGVTPANWMVGYKEMRMLRALFPDGHLIVHDSIPQNGWAVAQFKPFLYTYATFTYLAENTMSNSGIHWLFPRYVTSQFRKSNSLGVTKGSEWKDFQGKLMGERNSLVTLVYNGRNNHSGMTSKHRKYRENLEKLYELWKQKGDQPHFYDRYYLPMAQKLTGYKIGRTAMPIVERHDDGKIVLKSLTPDAVIHYTTDGTIPTKDSPEYKAPITVDSRTMVQARAFAEKLDPSVVARIAPMEK